MLGRAPRAPVAGRRTPTGRKDAGGAAAERDTAPTDLPVPGRRRSGPPDRRGAGRASAPAPGSRAVAPSVAARAPGPAAPPVHSGALIHLERVSLTAAAVERQHQLCGHLLAGRRLDQQPFQLADQLRRGAPAEARRRSGTRARRFAAPPGGGSRPGRSPRTRPRPAADRATAPAPRGAGRRPARAARRRARASVLDPPANASASSSPGATDSRYPPLTVCNRAAAPPAAPPARPAPCASAQSPSAADCRDRPSRPPHRIDQRVPRHGPIGMEHQESEQRQLSGPADSQPTLTLPDLDRSQNTKLVIPETP